VAFLIIDLIRTVGGFNSEKRYWIQIKKIGTGETNERIGFGVWQIRKFCFPKLIARDVFCNFNLQSIRKLIASNL
jgi:hypothetical protein